MKPFGPRIYSCDCAGDEARGLRSMASITEQVVEQLKRDPSHPVRATLDGLTVEVRAVSAETPDGRSVVEPHVGLQD